MFRDVLPEFGTRVLDLIQQPLEDNVVNVNRAEGTLNFSANFTLVAAMNPFPCGAQLR